MAVQKPYMCKWNNIKEMLLSDSSYQPVTNKCILRMSSPLARAVFANVFVPHFQ